MTREDFINNVNTAEELDKFGKSIELELAPLDNLVSVDEIDLLVGHVLKKYIDESCCNYASIWPYIWANLDRIINCFSEKDTGWYVMIDDDYFDLSLDTIQFVPAIGREFDALKDEVLEYCDLNEIWD